jgi:head-tail adaptor
MIRAGSLDKRIMFQWMETRENEFGEPVAHAPQVLGKTWAKVIYGKGSERRAAAVEGSALPATFQVRDSALSRSIDTSMQIAFDGANWDIESNVPWGRDGREITATRLS